MDEFASDPSENAVFELPLLWRDPSYTPPLKEISAVLALAQRAQRAAERKHIVRLLTSGGMPFAEPLQMQFAQCDETVQPVIVEALGRIARKSRLVGNPNELLEEWLLERAEGGEGLVQLRAVEWLAKSPGHSLPVERVSNLLGSTRTRLTAKSDSAESNEDFDALSAAKIRAASRLGIASPTTNRSNDESARIQRANQDADRIHRAQGARDGQHQIRSDQPLPSSVDLLLHMPAGLEEPLLRELNERQWQGTLVGPGRVRLRAEGLTFNEVMSCRLFNDFALIPSRRPLAAGQASSASWVDALGALLRELPLTALTDGTVRYRIGFSRNTQEQLPLPALVEKLGEYQPEWVNDSRGAEWKLEVHVAASGAPYLECYPATLDDSRFSYRAAMLPAASNPVVAACLAAIARDITGSLRRPPPHPVSVWDPFCGSGLELIEFCIASQGRTIGVGTDLDVEALEASRMNLKAVRAQRRKDQRDAFRIELIHCDAGQYEPRGQSPELLLSNPPFGRRIANRTDVAALLTATLEHFARIASPQAWIVWLSPLPELTRSVALKLGFRSMYESAVNISGVDVELQVWRR
jgi:23S rRNA G2445 N2-methylase RlmL